jgi:hypothetical protein
VIHTQAQPHTNRPTNRKETKMLFLKIKTSEHVSPFVLSIIERATKCNDLDEAQTSLRQLNTKIFAVHTGDHHIALHRTFGFINQSKNHCIAIIATQPIN